MAKDKKSFILYCDQKGLWDKLSDDQAGKLIKHILSYVNDENPTAPDFITELAFEPIKQQLKRDLKDWEETRQNRSVAGKAGAEARWQNIADDGKRIKPMAKMAVNVNVNDNVNDNVNEKTNNSMVAVSTATFEDREKDFMNKLAPFVETYGKEMLREFYNYWTERNDNGKKMRFEMQKVFQVERRLTTWSKNIKQGKNAKQPTASTSDEWRNIAKNYLAAKESGAI